MNMDRRQFVTLSGLSLLSLAAAVACSPSGQKSSSGSAATVRLGFSAWPGWFPTEQVASDKSQVAS
jgi:NitT/TauT family transport system substrate-binding protein